jgi:hypothetical protein
MSRQGTCIDLALFIAACLEQLRYQPLIALLDMGTWWHALIGCWTYRKESLKPILTEKHRIMPHTMWVDPNGCTQDQNYGWTFSQACDTAHTFLIQQPFLYALDVAAARPPIGNVTPYRLPENPCGAQKYDGLLRKRRTLDAPYTKTLAPWRY